MPLHARTSRRCLTRQQPHLNLLRTTSEAFSAAVGGAETIHVDGFDAARSAESGFARRLARNLQYILRDEAFVAEVMDPGGGSYFLERMTAELAARAWAVLQEVEAKGGLESALREGWVQATIASAHEEALARAEVGDLVRIGVNKYPAASTEANAGAEAPPARERKRNGESVQKGRDPERVHAAESALAEAVAARARAKDEASAQTLVEAALSAAEARMSFRELSIVLSRGGQESSKVEPTPLRREAAPFEDFKERIETARAKGGKFSVLPITLGATAAHASRLGFARAFFEVGGFEVLPERRGEDSKQTLETVKSSKAAVLLLCATDEDCASDALALIERLKAARPESILVLAGQPGDSNLRARLEQAGVEEFVTSKSPVLATLEPLAKRLGVN